MWVWGWQSPRCCLGLLALCCAWWCCGVPLSPWLGGSIWHFTMQEAVLEREHVWHPAWPPCSQMGGGQHPTVLISTELIRENPVVPERCLV